MPLAATYHPVCGLRWPTHHPPQATPTWHPKAQQAPHIHEPASAHRALPCANAAIRPQIPPAAGYRMPPTHTPMIATNGPALRPRQLGLPTSRAPPCPLPNCGERNPHRRTKSMTPAAPRPREPPELLLAPHRHRPGRPGRTLRGGPPDSHWPVPKIPHLQLLDQCLPNPRIAAPAPEAWEETVPEELAEYLRHACLWFNNASGRPGATPYPLSKLLYPAAPTPPNNLGPPEGWATSRDTHLVPPSKAATTEMDPMDQRAYSRDLQGRTREAHRWHLSVPSPPGRQRGAPAPDAHRARRPKRSKGPADPPANRARCSNRDWDQATLHCPTSRAPI